MCMPKNSSMLQIFAFYDFVVSCQFFSFVTKIELVARITSSRLVFTGLVRVWDGIDLVITVITVNASSRSQ